MKIDFNKAGGLVPAIIQDYFTGEVLMLGYMNEEAYEITINTGYVTFFSRSGNRLWKKGETSGSLLIVKSINQDCDNDALLIKVVPKGPVCHTGMKNCFGMEAVNDLCFLNELEKIISLGKDAPGPNSYTSSLFVEGLNRIAQKVGEEAVEFIIASKENDPDNFLNEAADLLYHYLVLLQQKNFHLNDVLDILKSRNKK